LKQPAKSELEDVSSFFCHSEAAIAAVGIRSLLGITDCHAPSVLAMTTGTKQLDKSEFEADGMLIGGKENTNYICLKMGENDCFV
jgi:hypothetical protein